MTLQVLNQNDINRIQEASLDILEKGGIWIKDCPEAMELFRKHGCAVDGDRVRIPRKLVADCIASLPDRNDLQLCVSMLGFAEPVGLKQGQVHVGLIGNIYSIYDHEKGERIAVEADIDDKDLVLDNLDNFEFDCCFTVTESQRLGEGSAFKYDTAEQCIEYLSRRVNSRPSKNTKKLPFRTNLPHAQDENPRIHCPQVIRPMERLELLRHAVIRGPQETEELLANDTPLVWCNPISPLQYHAQQVREIMQTIKRYGTSCYISFNPEVMAGATGPVTLAGVLTQHNCEVLGGMVLTQLCAPGTAVIYGCVSGVMDMRNADMSLGNFETQLINTAAVQLADSYGLPCRMSMGCTSARKTGTRAAVEMAVGLQMGMAAGANIITTGLLDTTVMYSHEHIVLINDMISQFRGSEVGINTDPQHLAMDLIMKQGHPNPNYIGDEHTFEFMKEDVYYSDFTGRTPKSYEDWYDLANTKVKEILARKHEDPEEEKLVAERLAVMEARLKEDNQTWLQEKEDWWRFYVKSLV